MDRNLAEGEEMETNENRGKNVRMEEEECVDERGDRE